MLAVELRRAYQEPARNAPARETTITPRIASFFVGVASSVRDGDFDVRVF
jgi:hypothetical protein